MRNQIPMLICLLIIAFILIAGCSKYADPELQITSNLTRISDDAQSGNITYDVAIDVANTGNNNAYQVKILALLSTPKSESEYRFSSRTIDVGDIEKKTKKTFTERMTLPATKLHYERIMSGVENPEIETKLTSVTSNVMG